MVWKWFTGEHGRPWPPVESFAGATVPGDIKRLSMTQLARLMATARERSFSANGRPQWLSDRRATVSDILLTVMADESPAVYRCVVTVLTGPAEAGNFTLDVSVNDFDALPSLDRNALVRLSHTLLHAFPPVPLDPDQAQSGESP